MENNQDNMLREIANDNLTPKNTKKKVNTDGLFETTDCSHPDHQCTCGAQQIVLNEY